MAKRFSSDRMNQLARIGAQARIKELQDEIASIRAAFPGLAGASAGRSRPAASTDTPKPRRKRRKLSAKARAAISAAQKKRWAKHRAAKEK